MVSFFQGNFSLRNYTVPETGTEWEDAYMQLIAVKKGKMDPEVQTPPAPSRPRRKITPKRLVLLAVVAAAVAGGAVGVRQLFFSQEERTALTERTTYGSLATTIEGTGTTVPADSVTYTAASDSEITGVYVSAGDTVEAGQLLYTQDSTELDEQIETYQDEITELENTLSDAQSQLADLNESMAALSVTAPFSGRITDVTAEVGDSVNAGTKLTTEGTRCFAVTVTVENPGALTEGMSGAGYLVADSGEKLYPAVEGTLEYYASKDIVAEVSGELTAVNVSDYESVSKGKVLFSVDGSDLEKQVESVERSITQTQEKITQAQEKITQTEEQRADYNVTAEISGKVIMVGVQEGESPRQAGQTAVTLYNMDSMTITANIDELDIDNISMGMEVDVTQSGAETDTHYTGTVTAISYEATNTNGVAYFPITITIPSDGALSAGVNVSYTTTVGDESEGVLAPIAALQSTTEGVCLFVKAESRPDNAVDLEEGVVPDGFYAVPVETGVSNSQYVRILSGVEEDVEVFTRYQQAAPSGGDTTSQGESGQEMEGMPGFSGGGGMAGGNMGGGMPGGMQGGMGGGPMG